MTWVLTDNSDTTLSLDDLTFFANRFYWRSNFHSNNLLSIKSIVYYIIYISGLQVVFSGISNFLEILFFKRVHTMFCSLFFFLCTVIASPTLRAFSYQCKKKTTCALLDTYSLIFPKDRWLFITPCNTALCQIMRRHLHRNFVTRQNADEVFAKFAANMR